MASIMAHPQPVTTESTMVEDGNSGPRISRPSQYGMSSSASDDEYVPLPPGHWTLNFHGNCPRCHHHHRGLDVKVTAIPGDSRVSYIECERCHDRWAAFGGSNSTRISLLSTATSEPDLAERGVRYSLLDIVKLAPKNASLGTVSDTTSLGPCNDKSPEPPPHAREVFPVEPTGEFEDVELEAPPLVSPEDQIVAKTRSGTVRLLSKLKAKIQTRLHKLRRYGNEKHLARSYGQQKLSARQLEKFPAQILPAIDDQSISAEQPLMISDAFDVTDRDQAAEAEAEAKGFDVNVVGPAKRIDEVMRFVASLDKSVLRSMNEEERTEWMRKEYTSFKARAKKAPLRLGLSPIVHIDSPGDFPHLVKQPLNRLDAEVLGIGSHVAMVESLEAALRRGPVTISSEHDTDGLKLELLQRARPGPVALRPHSLESTTRPLTGSQSNSLYSLGARSVRSVRSQSLHASRRRTSSPCHRQRVRNSSDSLVFNSPESTSSIHARVSSLISQSSPLNLDALSLGDREAGRNVSIPVRESDLPDVNNWSTTSLIPGPSPFFTDRESTPTLISGTQTPATDTRSIPDLVPSPDPTLLESSIPELVPNNANIQSHGNSSNSDQGGGPPSSTHVGDDPTAADSGEPSGSKRSRREPPNENNDNNDTYRRKRKQRSDHDRGESSSKPFACPFPKHDPMKHTACWEFTFQKDRFGDLRYIRLPKYSFLCS
jgi:hypothetical protein